MLYSHKTTIKKTLKKFPTTNYYRKKSILKLLEVLINFLFINKAGVKLFLIVTR